MLLGMSASIVLWSVLNMLYLGWQNRRRARAGAVAGAEVDGRLGDRSVHYRYIL